MDILKTTRLQRVDAYFREFKSHDKELVVIEPGYIINMHAYKIWRLLDEEKSFDELVDCLVDFIINPDKEQLEKVIYETLLTFYKRGLLKIDGKIITQLEECRYSNALSEIELNNKYSFDPITQVDLIVTVGCNFRCRHCFINHKKIDSMEKLQLEDWKKNCGFIM